MHIRQMQNRIDDDLMILVSTVKRCQFQMASKCRYFRRTGILFNENRKQGKNRTKLLNVLPEEMRHKQKNSNVCLGVDTKWLRFSRLHFPHAKLETCVSVRLWFSFENFIATLFVLIFGWVHFFTEVWFSVPKWTFFDIFCSTYFTFRVVRSMNMLSIGAYRSISPFFVSISFYRFMSFGRQTEHKNTFCLLPFYTSIFFWPQFIYWLQFKGNLIRYQTRHKKHTKRTFLRR